MGVLEDALGNAVGIEDVEICWTVIELVVVIFDDGVVGGFVGGAELVERR